MTSAAVTRAKGDFKSRSENRRKLIDTTPTIRRKTGADTAEPAGGKYQRALLQRNAICVCGRRRPFKTRECDPPLVRREAWRAGFRLDLGCHHALGAGSEPDQHVLARAQLGHAETAQGLHV